LGLAATQAAYRAGSTTPIAVLAATLSRIAAAEPVLNAFAYVDVAGAEAAAASSTLRWQAGTPFGPLDGALLSIKDNIPVAGLPCCWGSRLFERQVPTRDELPVARLRAQGAVLLGKTNVSEFTLGRGTVSTELFGTTRNPWNPSKTTGASSGGAAAAVAAGLGAAALGTDGGGSIAAWSGSNQGLGAWRGGTAYPSFCTTARSSARWPAALPMHGCSLPPSLSRTPRTAYPGPT
jgi:aspartyl-tRNA(Asn)/glutamyl-tRNA(Gln) amidotransferase subunit A